MTILLDRGWALRSFSTSKLSLVDETLDPHLIRGANIMGLVYSLIMLPAVGMSFVMPVVSFTVLGLLVAAFIVSTAIGRSEAVTIWRVSSGSGG